MTNLHTTTALTEFTPLSPEQEDSPVSSFFAKVFNFKTSPSSGNLVDRNVNSAEPDEKNVRCLKFKKLKYLHIHN